MNASEQLVAEIENRANRLLSNRNNIKVLEAGCGKASYFTFDANVYLVGMDVSEEQLAQNNVVREKILGDIQTYPLPQLEFDVIVCWMVLEHLPRPQDALKNMFRALKPGGLLIIGIPNLLSVKGVVTKFTPFWFHEMFYSFMHYTSKHFPTYLRAAIIPQRIVRYASSEGLELEYCRLLEGAVSQRVRQRFKVIDIAFALGDLVVRGASFGKLNSPLMDACALILTKST